MAQRRQRLAMTDIPNRTLQLGYVGEHIHTIVTIDCSYILFDQPDAEVILKVLPTNGEIYEPEITQDGTMITWTLTKPELAYRSGTYQLTFVDGEEIIKSDIGSFTVNESLQEVS